MKRSIVALAACGMAAWAQQSAYEGRPAIILETSAAKLVVDLGGGSIVDFRLANSDLNPLRWLGPGDEKEKLRPMAHFLCLDRWGQPSEAELRNGMPYHGEAARVMWTATQPPSKQGESVNAEMTATLPMAGFDVRRTVRLASTGAVFVAAETVTNRNKLGRPYNMVQHPTIGPPFLDETTVVDSNAGKGFMQSSPMPTPEKPELTWPMALKDGKEVDLRHLTTDAVPDVVSFVIDGEYGWVTATTANKGLIIGYLWKTADYPWLDIWRHVVGGKPFARGLEFGTTGLHQPFGVLVAKRSIFGRGLMSYLDTGESATRSYAAFLVKAPADFDGVQTLTYSGGRIVLKERKQPARELVVEAGNLF